MAEEIVKQVFVTSDGAELSIDTPFVVAEVKVPTMMRVPLHDGSGQIISTSALAELGLTLKGYTQAELDAAEYAALYAANPTLADRVRQYKALLDTYNLPVTATSDEISAAIQADTSKTDAEKTAAGAALLTLIHDIEINYAEAGRDGLAAWSDLPKLIQYLPEEA